MIDKYYTPKIENLYVGFECEYSTLANTTGANHPNWEITDDVISGKLDTFLLKSIIIETVEEGKDMPIRVKYLDQVDLESFGYSNKPVDYINGLVGRNEYIKEVDEKVIKIQVYWDYDTENRENLIRIYIGTKYNFPYTEIFRGNIPNKSELGILLNQMGIL